MNITQNRTYDKFMRNISNTSKKRRTLPDKISAMPGILHVVQIAFRKDVSTKEIDEVISMPHGSLQKITEMLPGTARSCRLKADLCEARYSLAVH